MKPRRAALPGHPPATERTAIRNHLTACETAMHTKAENTTDGNDSRSDLIAAIDPGITGAIAWLSPAGHLIEVQDLPTSEIKVGKTTRRRMIPAILGDMLVARRPAHLFLEEVATRPGEGSVGAFSFGRGFGQIEGILAGLQIPYTLVRPQAWKKLMGVPADKGSARAIACRMWPGASGQFARVKDDGRAESALIGAYGCRVRGL